MRLTITIECDNAAFGETYENARAEAMRIIAEYNLYPDPRDSQKTLIDKCGNRCGVAKWTGVTAKWLKERNGAEC